MDHLFCLGGKLPSINTLAEGGRKGSKGWCSIFGVFIQLIKFCNKVRKKSFRSGVLCRESIMDSIFIYIRFKFINNDLLQIHTEFISQTRKGSVFLSDKLSPHQFSPGEICYVADNVSISQISIFNHIADSVRFNKFPLGSLVLPPPLHTI